MLRGAAHPHDHSPILAAALIASLAVLGGIVPGVPGPVRLPTVEVPALAQPGSSLLGVIRILEQGFRGCHIVQARLTGRGGNELNALRTAYPKSRTTVPGDISELPPDLLVCPR